MTTHRRRRQRRAPGEREAKRLFVLARSVEGEVSHDILTSALLVKTSYRLTSCLRRSSTSTSALSVSPHAPHAAWDPSRRRVKAAASHALPLSSPCRPHPAQWLALNPIHLPAHSRASQGLPRPRVMAAVGPHSSALLSGKAPVSLLNAQVSALIASVRSLACLIPLAHLHARLTPLTDPSYPSPTISLTNHIVIPRTKHQGSFPHSCFHTSNHTCSLRFRLIALDGEP